MTKNLTAGSKGEGEGKQHKESDDAPSPEIEADAGGSSLLPATPGASVSASDARPSKRPSSAVERQTPTRLPPSAPTSSLLPSIATAPDPSQLLAQYSLLLQGGSHAGAFLNPFLGTSGATAAAPVAPSSVATASLLSTPSLPGGESSSSSLGGSGTAPIASQLISSLAAQIVAAQQASAQVAAAAAAAAAYNAPAPAAATPAPAPAVAAAPSAVPSRPCNMMLPTGVQSWSSAQLANQPSLLSSLSKPVAPSLSLLVTEAQRRHEKKEAKKIANRRSASVSRARKKALVQEMTELNAKLRRQALILALLPDLVIVVDEEGVINFCSSQVERILSYAPDLLVGSKLTDLLVPSSRKKLLKLFKEIIGQDGKLESISSETDLSNSKKRRRPIKAMKEVSEESDIQDPSDDVKNNAVPSSKGAAGAEASDASFPMSVVNVDVDSKPEGEKQTSDDNENNSDTSGSRDSKRPSSLTNSVRSPIGDSLGNSGSDDGVKEINAKKAAGKKLPSSDTSNTSSSMDQANANLERNVRWHNKKLKSLQSDAEGIYKDDVIGAAVTANNASARLSSLRVQAERPEGSSSEEDDSGYRESNESREETSSTSASDLTESNGRRKPLAPTCNICLIRSDLSTLWCEVTSSVRARDSNKELEDGSTIDMRKPPPESSRTSSVSNDTEVEALPSKSESVKEILLCLRPIRDGDEKVDPKYRFVVREKREVSDDSRTGLSSSVSAQGDPSSSWEQGQKRKAGGVPVAREQKRTRAESDLGAHADVAASLVLMSSRKN